MVVVLSASFEAHTSVDYSAACAEVASTKWSSDESALPAFT